jgi:hypothetical protein
MPTEGGDTASYERALQRAVAVALAGLPDGDRDASLEALDSNWLGIGLRLGLERPDEARLLLAMIEVPAADPSPLVDRDAAVASPADPTAVDGPGNPVPIPVASSLLARAAALPAPERVGMGPDVAFGWAAGLTPRDILSLGRVVGDMLAAGAPPDVGRGFGLTWDAGVRLPRKDLDAMFREFTELEVTVGGVLSGRDLRSAEPAPRSRGLGALFDSWLTRTRPQDAQAAAAFESSGEPGRRGLVALWNAWAAMRYRDRIPPPTFELLVRPWVTVVGPLPTP